MYLLLQMVWGPFNAVFLPLWESGKRVAVQYTGVGSVSAPHPHHCEQPSAPRVGRFPALSDTGLRVMLTTKHRRDRSWLFVGMGVRFLALDLAVQVKELDVRYELLSSFLSSAVAAAISNPMVRHKLSHVLIIALRT